MSRDLPIHAYVVLAILVPFILFAFGTVLMIVGLCIATAVEIIREIFKPK